MRGTILVYSSSHRKRRYITAAHGITSCAARAMLPYIVECGKGEAAAGVERMEAGGVVSVRLLAL